MSKYAYTTVYEEFTGLKPPEPKAGKPRRRRGYGHPYRMRLNMQDDVQPGLENANEVMNSPKEFKPYDHQHQPRHIVQTNMKSTGSQFEKNTSPSHAPKVTYKKRRHYSMMSQNQTDSID